VSYGDVLARKISKAELHHFEKKGLKPKRFLREFRVDDTTPFEVGQVVPVTIFKKGELVDVSGMNKGRGFAGVVKRHGFAGGPHSHGHGEYRKSPGSSGAQGPQHVLPGTRKPGHKGHIWQTIQNVEVVEVDTEKHLVLLRGSVPGPNGNFVVIRSSR
jgi:large subunit ribosomal protein L3